MPIKGWENVLSQFAILHEDKMQNEVETQMSLHVLFTLSLTLISHANLPNLKMHLKGQNICIHWG